MKIRAKQALMFLIILSFSAAFLIPGSSGDDIDESSIGFVGILFGIIVGFFITDLYTRYQGVRENAAIESSSLSTIFWLSQILQKNKKNHKWYKDQIASIHEYIKSFMPTPWHKYEKTSPKFTKILENSHKAKCETKEEIEAYSNLLGTISQYASSREKLIMFGKDKLTWGEWITVHFLGAILLLSLFYVKTPALTSAIFTGSITAAILILMFVLKDLNDLNFGESAISVEPYQRVLDLIGKPRIHEEKGNLLDGLLGRN